MIQQLLKKEILKSAILIMNLSISPADTVTFFFVHFEALLLAALIYRIVIFMSIIFQID